MLVGCDHALTAAGDADHALSGCSATDLGQSKDRKEKSFLSDFFWFFLLWLTPPLFQFFMHKRLP
jgi:hypothetical protein